jgi:dUTP pyrophosphatase
MEKAAKFEKVSFGQFAEGWKKLDPEASAETVKEIYDNLKMPKRATAGSAGYDFFAPADITLLPQEEALIPTGIRVKMKKGYVLMLFPRSSLGFKYRMQLNNTVGIIDSDYYHADNEGHIFCKITNDSKEGKTLSIRQSDGMVQGIFLAFGITEDDAAEEKRTGGFGSTDKRKTE